MIRLQRSVEIKSFNLEATVATAARRPEYLAVLQLAVDLQRPLDARTVHHELFGALPDSVGRIVLDRCVLLGLFDRERPSMPAHVSDAGRAALMSGDILLAEEGLWRIFYLDDLLLGRRLVHAQPLHDGASAEDTRRRVKQKSKPLRSMSTNVPPLLHEASKGDTWFSIIDNRAFELRELAPRGEEGPTGTLRLHLDSPEDGAMELALRGKLVLGDKHPAQVDQRLGLPEHIQDLAHDDLWRGLISLASGIPLEELSLWRENAELRLLPQYFAGLPEATLRTMRCDLDIPAHQHRLLGPFEATRLTGVSVVPRRGTDAQEWAEWLEWDALSTYVVPDVLRARSAELAARFPYHRPILRAPEALLEHAARNPTDRRSRFLLAPADLGLWS